MNRCLLLGALGLWLIPTWTVDAAPPRPDHVLIVVEENHAFTQVIGSPDAPYINSLVAVGASFTHFHGITHPSQPNYLQLFSGDNQGAFDNTVPAAGTPFTTPNLGAALLAANATFVGYSEDLPEIGSIVGGNLSYYRKHNPWVNWQADVPGFNQLSPQLNRPFFTSDPTPRSFYGDLGSPPNFADLPTVTIVVPNQQHDMHDGTIAMADNWLLAHIAPYVEWCADHNSLFILTWDEDNSAERNRIPTVFVGPMVVPGHYHQTYTLHNLLRTLEDMYTATPSGAAANCRSIVGCFTSDGIVATRSFRQGEGGYADAKDTWLESAAPDATHGSDTILVADGSPLSHPCIGFADVFGVGPSQIPPGVTILSAKLLLLTGAQSADDDASLSTMQAHRMIRSWSDASTWVSMLDGVSADGTDAAIAPSFMVRPNVLDAWAIFDVTADVQAFSADPALNQGWAILPTGTDGWRFASSETAVVADRPLLEITYDPTTGCPTITQQPRGLRVLIGQDATFTVVATGAGPMTFQWRKAGTDISDSERVSGTTRSTLSLTGVTTLDSDTYEVVISNSCGQVISTPARLHVCAGPPSGNMNADGATDGADISLFVSAIESASSTGADVCAGDFSANAMLDPADLPGMIAVLLAP